ncbi:hypothetical protein KIN20_023565 [Parelaphostrongylus tenuis]|uniref:Uncharacterized protein n=1 Tax=Parelaphostrongylus tenuis TaxID=148309 RepID=A0AAD5MS20_PARTN|nr:hypothetical protein KIN20_023565 [Parelaphostrongylus tenuis]
MRNPYTYLVSRNKRVDDCQTSLSRKALENSNITDVAGIATTSDSAKSFASRLVMQTIIDVLEQHGLSAGLCDAIVSGILSQLMVQISYDPLERMTVFSVVEQQGRSAGLPDAEFLTLQRSALKLAVATGRSLPKVTEMSEACSLTKITFIKASHGEIVSLKTNFNFLEKQPSANCLFKRKFPEPSYSPL